MNVQTEYYIRLLLVLVQGGMLVCKGVINTELASTALDVVLKPHEPKLRKKLLKSQLFVLFPKSGKPDVEDLDLSLLTVVLLDVMILSTSDIQFVKTIKETRNKLAHNSTASIEDTEYNILKTDLEDALTKLCLGLDVAVQTECSKLIQKFTSDSLDEAVALKYAKELRNEDELLQDFEGMLEKQSEDIVQEIKASENRMQESLSEVKQSLLEEFEKLHTGFTSDNFTHSAFPDTLPDCEVCSPGENTRSAVFYCEICCRFMCSDCNTIIHTAEKMHNRQRIDLGKPVKFDLKGYDMCDEHKKSISYICKADNKLCCDVCIKEKHELCTTITSISKEPCEPKCNPTMEIPRLQNEARLLIAWMSSLEAEINKNVENIPAKLDEQRNAVLELFDKEAQKIKEKALAVKTNTTKEIKKNKKNCEDVIVKTEQAKLSLINMTKCGTNSQNVIAQYRMKELAEELKYLTDISMVSLSLEHLKVPEQLGLHSEILSVQVEAPSTRPVQLFKIKSLELKQGENGKEEPFYTGMDFLPDGRLVAVDNKNKLLLIYNEKLEKLGSYQLSYYPHSVVAVSEEEVAITSAIASKIEFLRVSKCNEITIIRTCEVKGKYASLCLKDDKHLAVGTFNYSSNVCFVSLSGKEKGLSINFSDKKYAIDSSASTYIRNSDKVVFTDRYEHTVYIYDTTTKEKVVCKDVQIKEPRHVAVGPFDCIFVCSLRTDSIVQLSPSGPTVASHKIDMTYPTSICFSKDKTRLAISNCYPGKKCLQLFRVAI